MIISNRQVNLYIVYHGEKNESLLFRKYFRYCLYHFFPSLCTFFHKIVHIINMVTVMMNHFKLGFTPCKVEEPLRGMELQETEEKIQRLKANKRRCLERA